MANRTLFFVLLLTVIMISVAAIGSRWYSSGGSTLIISSNSELGNDSPENSRLEIDPEILSKVADPNEDIVFDAFRPVSEHELQRLKPWIDDVFIPDFEFARRYSVVELDTSELIERLEYSLEQSNGDVGAEYPGINKSDVNFSLFSDVVLGLRVRSIRVNESNRTRIAATVVEGAGGRLSRARLSISQDGELTGTFYTNTDTFGIFPTPELPYYIVVEVDDAAWEAQRLRDAAKEIIDPRSDFVQ